MSVRPIEVLILSGKPPLSSFAADSSVVQTPENSPVWSERLHFPNLQGHRREGASREPLSCQRGKAIQLENGLRLLISSQVTVLPRPLFFFSSSFFHANGKSSNTARKYISLGCTLIGSAFNMGTFTAKDFAWKPPQRSEKHAQRPGVDVPPLRVSFCPGFPSSRRLCMFTGDHIDSQLRD